MSRVLLGLLLAVLVPASAAAQVAVIAPVESEPPEQGVRLGPQGVIPPPPRPDRPAPPPRDQPQIYKIAVAVAARPDPPLRYRFVASSADLKPGNSVPFIYRAIVQLGGENNERNRKFEERHERLSEMPIAELPKEEVRGLVAGYADILHELERAAERERTEWEWRFEELSGDESISFLLPEIQQARLLARVLHLKARLEIAEGRYDDAAATLRVGYRLGRDVAEPPTIINGLVGIAIHAILHQAVVDLIATEGSPNLYWVISTLPSPVVDLTTAMEHELAWPERFAPWLGDPQAVSRTPGQWRDAFVDLLVEFGRVNGTNFEPSTSEGRLAAGLGVTGLALRSYSAAKSRLVEAGFDPAAVEAMPVGEVLAVAEKRYLDEVSQELLKGFYLPPPASHRALARAEDDLKRRGLFGRPWATAEPLPIGSVLFPATTQALRAQVRLDAKTAGLRAVEAVRLHAAATGKLPASLDEIEAVPVPANPFTGEPFPYRLEGGVAVLDVTVAPESPSVNWRFELSLKK